MKTLSYAALAAAAACVILGLIARYAFGGRVVVFFTYYIKGVEVFLLASILFALYHLIGLKAK